MVFKEWFIEREEDSVNYYAFDVKMFKLRKLVKNELD